MEKLKTIWSKYKGYLLTFALATLTAVETYGAPINDLCGGALTIKGVEVLPMVSLGATVVVGLLSNGYTAEQNSKIKALFSKASKNELVTAEIKKTIKTDEAKLKEYNKQLTTKQTELDALNTVLKNCKNTHEAKKQMYEMTPRLATAEEVQEAANEVVNTEARIVEKRAEIEKLKVTIDNLNTTIAALKSQLK